MVISSPVGFKGEAKLINDLFEHGLEIFHLRKPEWGIEECREILTQIDARYHDRVALHQCHELMFDYGINRLHFPEKRRIAIAKQESVLTAFSDLGSDQKKILSTSVHRVEDINSLYGFDYTFFGPLFDSYSKPGYKGVSGDEADQVHVSKKNAKVIALGGIGLNTIARMKRMGFDGAAMLGWVWNDPLKAIDNFKQVKCWVKDHM